jgi:phage terminase Nu1 subunit (DNA packaging protein)
MGVKNDIVTSGRPWLDAELSKIELARLLGKSAGAVDHWARVKGLPQTASGKFNLRQALLWIEQYYRRSKTRTIGGAGLTEQDLSRLFGITRQTVFVWRRKGLPRSGNGTYSLAQVCRWLRDFYQQRAEIDYQVRLDVMRKKVTRTCRQQLQSLLAGGKSK